ncbi:MAG: hypothetical protein K0S56_727 [Microvirga sp.]|jgi:hypothetical protein|nr:hypothetical protein [Microvirga sp.]
MLARKFDIDGTSLAYDRGARQLALTVQPIVPDYDEAALVALGWGVMAGCPELRRLVIDVELDDVALPLNSTAMKRAA